MHARLCMLVYAAQISESSPLSVQVPKQMRNCACTLHSCTINRFQEAFVWANESGGGELRVDEVLVALMATGAAPVQVLAAASDYHCLFTVLGILPSPPHILLLSIPSSCSSAHTRAHYVHAQPSHTLTGTHTRKRIPPPAHPHVPARPAV